MASKIIFSLVAGLFICQIVLATPVKKTGMQLTTSSSEGIFQKIIEALKEVEQKIDNITIAVAEGIEEAVEKAENTTLAFEQKVENAVNDILEKVSTLDENVLNCTARWMVNVPSELQGLRNASLGCVYERVAKLQAAEEKLKDIKEDIADLLFETGEAELKCAAKGSIFSKISCAIKKGAEFTLKVTALNARFQLASTAVLGELVALVPLAGVCTATHVAVCSAEISAALVVTADCIKDSL